MTIIETVFWGVVAGVVTSVFLFVLGRMIYDVFIPWYQKIIYHGVDLRGRWTNQLKLDSGAIYNYQLDIKQNAHKIFGDAVITKSGADNNYIQDFNIEGETWEGYVVVNMQSKTRVSLSFVSGLFKVEDRGSALKGSWAYRGAETDEVSSEFIELRRR